VQITDRTYATQSAFSLDMHKKRAVMRALQAVSLRAFAYG
jgi:hypothetical protein